jgi:hypothetical protein
MHERTFTDYVFMKLHFTDFYLPWSPVLISLFRCVVTGIRRIGMRPGVWRVGSPTVLLLRRSLSARSGCVLRYRRQIVLLQVQPTRCNVIQYSLLLAMLYMFRAVSPPIIRSSKLYTQHLVRARLAAANANRSSKQAWHARCCVYSSWAPDDGRRNRPNHVEHCQ